MGENKWGNQVNHRETIKGNKPNREKPPPAKTEDET